MIDWLVNRLREPSTWVGLGVSLAGFGTAATQIGAEIESGVPPAAAILVGLGGALGAVLKDPNNGRDSK